MTMPRIALFTLGGTIAMVPADEGGVVPALTGEALLCAVPDLNGLAEIVVHPFLQTASVNIGIADIIRLAKSIRQAVADGADGIVVTQGTDSMAETAFLLSVLLRLDVPVIVTGAMRYPKQVSADGPANILAAVRAALSPQLVPCGVLLCMNDRLYAGRSVEKRHTAALDAFCSPETGPVASHVEGAIIRHMVPDLPPHYPLETETLPYVALVTAVFDDDGALLDCLPNKTRGLVIAGFGGGHLSEAMADKAAALAQVMPVILASQTGAGPVLEKTYGYKGGEIDLIRRGLIPAGAYSPAKARLLLSCVLVDNKCSNATVREIVFNIS